MNNNINILFSSLSNFIIKTLRGFFRYLHKSKIISTFFYGFISFIVYIFFLVQISGDSDYNFILENKRINDATKLNSIYVNKIIKPTTVEEISKSIKESTGPISIGGAKYSMGGQTAFENSLHIDMRSYNKIINLNTLKKEITVQPGLTWRELQNEIDPHNLSVKIMQTYANFSIGGSISVNAHGRYVGHGPIISSVISMKVVLSSGEIIEVSRTKNEDIFNAVVGGYGGIGVIVEATLQLVDNVKVERQVNKIKINNYNSFFNENIKNDKDVIFQNGNLYPPNYENIMNVSWRKTNKALTNEERVTQEGKNYWIEHLALDIISWGDTGKWIRKNIIDPYLYSADRVLWRNKEASYDVQELGPLSRDNGTYVLQEYFIPVLNIKSFIPKMKNIYKKYNVNIINVSLRHALADHESYLSWAKEEVFAFVIYYKQNVDQESKDKVKKWTQEITDEILSENGTWYLPYQPHATVSQFNKGYPNAQKYFDLKNRLDPNQRFTNKLLDKYNPYIINEISRERKKIKSYFRPEEQTLLTIPEWYLVFNPKEYSDYLESGKNPSGFPFYESINEYWSLYDRSIKLTSLAYPTNDEYKTMLQVIGVSITIEYGLKMIYENTIGSLFSLFSENEISSEEKIIIQAQRAYSDFIYNTAWYEFQFMPWIKKVWTAKSEHKSSFLRKLERSAIFTLEFSFKALYSQLISFAASSTYEIPSENIYLYIKTNENISETKNLKIIKTQKNKMIIEIQRWGKFTDTMIDLSNKNITIYEISGNDEISISVILDKNKEISFMRAKKLYDSKIITKIDLKRTVVLLPVNEVLNFIKYTKENNIVIEHIYDY
ncbi:MAG: FAD-dependent oxidoreductase [Campylobacteraceae bacterium]|nr:FAD-dependent oxidoreductase [Campylobacteraceae bacterium]